jgi:ABC-2 type transport system permease protein
MKQFINILEICRDEFTDVFHDRGVLIFILFVPLFYPLLYSYVYTNEVVRDVPVAVVDENHTNFSRELLRYIDATPDIKIISYCTDMREARDLVEKRDAYGIIRIPRTFTEDIARGDQSYVGVYCDMSSMLYYKGIVLGTNLAAFEKIQDVKIGRYMHDTTKEEDKISRMPIDFEEVALFNPQSGFASFLIPPVLMLIIQQTLLLGIGMTMGRVRERNRGYIIPLKRMYKNPVNIVLGKMLFYMFIYIIMAIYMYTYVNKAFALPCIGNYWTFLAFVIPFLLACIFFSMVFSAFVYRREDCIMLFVFISVPLLFMSGVSWPGSAIPRFWKIFSYVFPSTFGINGYVRISSMGATLHDVAFEYQSLWLQTGIYFFLAVTIYLFQIRKLARKIKI